MDSERNNTPCTNCNHPFYGRYCPNCGQSVTIYEKPVGALFKEFFGDLFAFDSRFWRSIPALLVRPGTMVSEYIGGKHALYMPPFRLYVFVSFFFFLVLDIFTTRALLKNKNEIANTINLDSINQEPLASLQTDTFSEKPDTLQKKYKNEENQVLNIQIDGSDSTRNKEKLKDIIANPESYISRFNKNLSWSFFLLMPALGFLFWLFFRKNRPFFVPHFLFAVQLHTVLFLALIIIMGSSLLLSTDSDLLRQCLGVLLVLHAVFGARKLYEKGWITTFFRLSIATFIYLIMVGISTALMAIYIFAN